jgi:hypothetical protein
MSLLAPLGLASTAHADPSLMNCPLTGIDWTGEGPINPDGSGGTIWDGAQNVVTTVTPTFFVSETHVVQNGTNQTAMGSFTSTVAKTFSYTVGGSASASFFGLVTATVSGSITQSTTTTTGVTATAPIPPGGTLVGQFGVAGYQITVTQTGWISIGSSLSPTDPGNFCGPDGNGTTTYSIQAPTVSTGWRVVPG